MPELSSTSSKIAVPLWVVLVAFAGAMAALAGGYWDDAWHTDRGRDEFFIAPHIAIYAGIALSGAALALWALLAARAHGTAAVWRHKPLTLALLSVGVTMASGPIDNVWHEAFGRDSVIWSPPHMLGIAGTLALGAAILAELAGRSEPWGRSLTVMAGALVLAAAGFTTAEYDTDAPQFDEALYLPALGFAMSIGLVLVRTASPATWAATASAATYTTFMVAVGGFLLLVDFPPAGLPLIVLAAVAVDVAGQRGWHPARTAAAFTVALHLTYVPLRNWVGDGVRFDSEDVVLGAAMTFAATLIVFWTAAGRPVPRRSAMAQASLASSMLLALALAPQGLAHDPGQGKDAGTVDLRITVDDRKASLAGALPSRYCGSTEPVAVVARRAGEVRRGALIKDGCELAGSLEIPDRGRWFIYAEMRRQGQLVESWLPVSVAAGEGRSVQSGRYAYFPPERSDSTAKIVAGTLLYAGMLALIYATFALVRGSRRAQARPA